MELYHNRGSLSLSLRRGYSFIFSNLLISSIHFCVNWILVVVFSPLLKTLLQIGIGFVLFPMFSPLSEMANTLYE